MAKDEVFTFLSKVTDNRLEKNAVYGMVKAFEYFDNNTIEIIVRKKRSRRSDQQNRYWFAIVTILSKELGYEKTEMHEILKFKFLKREKYDENTGEVYQYIGSTAKLNKLEFADMTSELIRWAASLNIILPLPNEQLTIS